MGMYSWTDYCDIHIRKGKRAAFEKYLKELRKEERPNWEEYGKEHAGVIHIGKDDEVEIQIESWKIISYWYADTLRWFDKLSEFLEGELVLMFETGDEKAIIHFGEGGTTYDIGEMKYETYTSKQLGMDRK